MKTEQIDGKQYIKSKLKAFLDTFVTLGDIIGGTSNVSKMTDAEIEAEQIRKESNLTRIKDLEKRVEIPEKSKDMVKKERKSQKVNNSIKTDIQRQPQQQVKEKTNSKTKQVEGKGFEIGE